MYVYTRGVVFIPSAASETRLAECRSMLCRILWVQEHLAKTLGQILQIDGVLAHQDAHFWSNAPNTVHAPGMAKPSAPHHGLTSLQTPYCYSTCPLNFGVARRPAV